MRPSWRPGRLATNPRSRTGLLSSSSSSTPPVDPAHGRVLPGRLEHVVGAAAAAFRVRRELLDAMGEDPTNIPSVNLVTGSLQGFLFTIFQHLPWHTNAIRVMF